MPSNKNNTLQSYYLDSDFRKAREAVAPIEKFDGTTIESYSTYLKNILHVVRHESPTGDLFIYNYDRGCYEPLSSWRMQMLFKHLLNRISVNWCSQFETEMLGAFKRSVTETVRAFNADNELNFQNGVLNLNSGKFREHNPRDTFFTTVLDYAFDESAECPMFESFIRETACGDPELISVIQEMFGYCCSVDTKAEKAFFCYGAGSNGKSLLGRVMTSVIGADFTCGVSLEGLNKTFALGAFIGKRLNISGENENMPNSEKLKTIISGDRMNIPIKYREDVSCELFAKNVFLMNSLPTTKDLSAGFFRKILIIPFRNSVPPEKMDRDLFEKLLTERPGIFNWAYAGYCRLRENNFVFSESAAVNQLTTDYIIRENPTGVFFHDNYIAKSGSRIPKSCLYPDYQVWAAENDHEVMDRQKFFCALKLKAEESGSDICLDFKKSGNNRYLRGYAYKSPKEEG